MVGLGWVQAKRCRKTLRNPHVAADSLPSNRRVGAFYAAPHAWASGAPRPTLAVDHTRDRCPAGRTDPRHTPSEARARPAAALPVGVPLLPRVRVRPGRSFIGLYGLPRGFSNVKIWRHRSFLAETAVPRDFEEGESIIARVLDERTTADRIPSTLDEFLHQVEQLERFLHPLFRCQQHDVRRHVERLLVAPLPGVASRHEPLPALDADLGAEHLLLVRDLLAVLPFPVVAVRVIGDFEQVVFHRLDTLLTCLRVERGEFGGKKKGGEFWP
jgi:hypothetical protein